MDDFVILRLSELFYAITPASEDGQHWLVHHYPDARDPMILDIEDFNDLVASIISDNLTVDGVCSFKVITNAKTIC